MKKLTIHLSDHVVSELDNAIRIKAMCGALFGLVDEFVTRIVKAIKNQDTEIFLETKKDRMKSVKRRKPSKCKTDRKGKE